MLVLKMVEDLPAPGGCYGNVTSTRRPLRHFNGDRSAWRGEQVSALGVWN